MSLFVRYAVFLPLVLTVFAAAAQPRGHTLGRRVIDGAAGEYMAACVVRDPQTGRTAESDPRTYYSLTLPVGDYAVVFTMRGYMVREEMGSTTGDRLLNVSTATKITELAAVVVFSEPPGSNVTAPETGLSKLSSQTVGAVPAMMGEADVLKAIQLMPGV